MASDIKSYNVHKTVTPSLLYKQYLTVRRHYCKHVFISLCLFLLKLLTTFFTFAGSLVLVGCVLAYRTRDLDPKYGEAKQLGTNIFASSTCWDAVSMPLIFLCFCSWFLASHVTMSKLFIGFLHLTLLDLITHYWILCILQVSLSCFHVLLRHQRTTALVSGKMRHLFTITLMELHRIR